MKNLPQQQGAPQGWPIIAPGIKTVSDIIGHDASKTLLDEPELSPFEALREAIDNYQFGSYVTPNPLAAGQRAKLLDDFCTYLIDGRNTLKSRVEELREEFGRTSPIIRALDGMGIRGDAVRAYHQLCAELAESEADFLLFDEHYLDAVDSETALLSSSSSNLRVLWLMFEAHLKEVGEW